MIPQVKWINFYYASQIRNLNAIDNCQKLERLEMRFTRDKRNNGLFKEEDLFIW